jgi:hypothetical protein
VAVLTVPAMTNQDLSPSAARYITDPFTVTVSQQRSERLSSRSRQPGDDRAFVRSEAAVADLARQLLGDGFEVTIHPRDLADFYAPATATDRAQGIIPDLKITSRTTGRYAYLEVKKQGSGGNAHERTFVRYAPGFISGLAQRTGLPYHPFFVVACEALATDRRYVTQWHTMLPADTVLLWEGYDPMIMAVWLDRLRSQFLEPALLGGPTSESSVDALIRMQAEQAARQFETAA